MKHPRQPTFTERILDCILIAIIFVPVLFVYGYALFTALFPPTNNTIHQPKAQPQAQYADSAVCPD